MAVDHAVRELGAEPRIATIPMHAVLLGALSAVEVAGGRAIPVASVLDQLVHLGVELTRFALYGRLKFEALGRTLLTLLVALTLAICGYSPEKGDDAAAGRCGRWRR
jgi:hypothetical protein